MRGKCHFSFYSLYSCGVLLAFPQARAFAFAPSQLPSTPTTLQSPRQRRNRGCLDASTTDNGERDIAKTKTILQPYEYDGWKLTYRTIAADDKNEPENKDARDTKKVLLIHPVGIGLASWFWEPLLEALGETSGSEKTKRNIRAYAPNLVGCGISEGSDAWDPDERGMFVPLGWVKACEALMSQIDDDDENFPGTQWTVVTQGGLAPIGVLLAARNPQKVENLVMASPPVWQDMVQGVPSEELERNYGFLRSPVWGTLAFGLLENRGIIEFFSNQFLFAQTCDDTWLDNTEREMCETARPPVQAFNAGMVLSRGLESELTETIPFSISRVVVVRGDGDKRPREDYETNMANCKIVTIPGTANVIPWERPHDFANLLAEESAAL
jgi:pimeloyl-ACP methyl ester carboxylesterase